jgi:hypothetical protein
VVQRMVTVIWRLVGYVKGKLAFQARAGSPKFALEMAREMSARDYFPPAIVSPVSTHTTVELGGDK